MKWMMTADNVSQIEAFKRTRAAFVWTRILNTPFWAIYNMLPFILYKEMHITPFQVMLIFILRPAVSLLAIYWSALVEKRTDRLLSNLIWARFLSHLPFFFFPFVENPWFFIGSFGFYMMLARGAEPAWMEVLKLNVPGEKREKIFAYGSAFGYLGTALIPFALGDLMDSYIQSWRWLFPATALISMSAIYFKWRIPIAIGKDDYNTPRAPISIGQEIIKPWRSVWELLKRRPDYRKYQMGFMLGGAGLIIIQPALPVFFMDVLNLSYTELAVALTLCKGIGVAVSSPTWARLLHKINIYSFNSWVTFLACLFPICLGAAQFNLMWLYCGYLLYGVMQGGSEMSWGLSGPIFAKNEDSSTYSNVNVITVGLRGCIFPAFGSLLVSQMAASHVMFFGAVFCLLSTLYMAVYSRQSRILNRSAQEFSIDEGR